MKRFHKKNKRSGQVNKWPAWQAVDPTEKFLSLPVSVRKSLAYRTLSKKQSDLLLLCWAIGSPVTRASKQRLPRDDYPGYAPYEDDYVFYMCREKAVRDGLYEHTNSRYDRDMKTLVEHGFLERLHKGNIGTMSVYKLVGNWKNYHPK